MVIRIDLESSVGDFIRSLDRVRTNLHRNLRNAQDRAGKYLLGRVRSRFSEQPSEWPDISPRWREWKAKHAYDTRKLLKSHLMKNSIYYKPSRFALGRIEGIITIPEGAKYPNMFFGGIFSRSATRKYTKRRGRGSSGIRIVDVAIIHEYGRGNIPQRPIFGPVAHKEADRVTRFFNDAVRQSLGNYA